MTSPVVTASARAPECRDRGAGADRAARLVEHRWPRVPSEQRHSLGDLGRVDLVRFHAADLVEHPQPRQGAVSDRQDTV